MLLIYPGGMPAALERLARAAGQDVLGASSTHGDSASAHYPNWSFLPRYDDPDFETALREVVDRYGVTKIYCPHTVVWRRLDTILPALLPQVALENAAPFVEEIASYRGLFRRMAAMRRTPMDIAAASPAAAALTDAEMAGLLHLARSIPGLCSEEKLVSLAEVFRHCPPGDVVEVGSWWGKSAVALGWLARRYHVGKLLCVDPWSLDEALQASDDVNEETARWDMEEVVQVFCANLATLAGDANYLRMPSREGAGAYRSGQPVTSEAFGETRYVGEIAMLHIDANHEFDSVRQDVELWAPLVRPGGWIVIDDYQWPFGDGPKVIGDRLLDSWGDDAACAFVSGAALFIQRRPA